MSEKPIYTENGCQYYNDCFTCPFPDCGLITMKSKKIRDNKILKFFKEGKNTSIIAQMFGVSIRTVERALKE